MSRYGLEGQPHSYERFAHTRVVLQTDSAAVQRAIRAVSIVDWGTGTGAAIEHLLENGKLIDPFYLIGLDIDEKALDLARRKFLRRDIGTGENIFLFLQRDLNNPVDEIQSGTQDLITCLNMIHLMDDPSHFFRESERMLKDGGQIVASTAYHTGAYPGGTASFWRVLVVYAQKKLREKGYTEFGERTNLFRFSVNDYMNFAEEAGFSDVRADLDTVYLDSEALKAICDYEGFAEGAFPGAPIEESTAALIKSVDESLERYSKLLSENGWPGIPRVWMVLTANKHV